MDSVVQRAIEQSVLNVAKHLEDQLDQQIHKLENLDDDDLERVRQRRIGELKKQQERTRQWLANGHGEYRELGNEKDFFKEIKGEERVICHFYRESWPCKVMDKHMDILAKRHIETKFMKINAEKSPFLTDKLRIWMLPTLALIKHEKTVDYVVGFDDMGGKDDFPTQVLVDRLAAVDMVRPDAASKPAQRKEGTIKSGIYSGRTGSDEDSDFDD